MVYLMNLYLYARQLFEMPMEIIEFRKDIQMLLTVGTRSNKERREERERYRKKTGREEDVKIVGERVYISCKCTSTETGV